MLDELIEYSPFGILTNAFLDQRYSPPPTRARLHFSTGKLMGRMLAEVRLHCLLKSIDNSANEKVLFFGNIPPFRKPKVGSVLYLQNCFLTRQVPLPKDSFKEMVRNWIESKLLKYFARNVDEIWVQTPWMKEVTQKYLPKSKVEIKPFLPHLQPKPAAANKRYSFVYVGSFALNKRLNFFLESLMALDLLIHNEIRIAIILDSPKKQFFLPVYKNIRVDLLFQLTREELSEKYNESECFVSTSLYESFCLPVYEAHFYNCKLVLPDAGYSRDLDFPVTIFPPFSINELAAKLKQSV